MSDLFHEIKIKGGVSLMCNNRELFDCGQVSGIQLYTTSGMELVQCRVKAALRTCDNTPWRAISDWGDNFPMLPSRAVNNYYVVLNVN